MKSISNRAYSMDTYDSSLAPRFGLLLVQREAQLRAILQASAKLSHEAVEAGQREVVDFKDVASEQILATVDEAKAEQAALELDRVLAARRRLEDRSYGKCLDCGEAIDLRRLTALPAAPFCTACQAIYEHEHAPALRR
jgi:DnaK suppressor protein